MSKQNHTVLLVDDSEDDRFFMRRSLSEDPRLNVVWEACNGEEAIAYLSGQEPFHDRGKYPYPKMLILDLKMPRKTGYDVLEWLRAKSQDLIVIVASGSFLPEDVARSFSLGARAYHKKSALKEEQDLILRDIERLLESCNGK